MHSDSALLLIGRLYAKVYDQSMDSDAAEHLHHLLSNIHDTTAIDEAIYAYQGEILGILLDSVNQSDSLELYTASTSQRESLNLAITALEDTPQSMVALDAIAQLAQVEPPAPGQAKIGIPTENLSSDARKLSALGLHQASPFRARIWAFRSWKATKPLTSPPRQPYWASNVTPLPKPYPSG